MIVYKFGGASISSAEGVERVTNIIKSCNDKLIIVVSAMGKTTNKIESILENIVNGNRDLAMEEFEVIKNYHLEIIDGLQLPNGIVDQILDSIKSFIELNKHANREYEYRYDALVSLGEMLSSTIISKYLESCNISNKLLNMRDTIITNNHHKEGKVDMVQTTDRLMRSISLGFNTYVVQGFIGGTLEGDATTLGREGSDYSAAIVANALGVESVTIWKDVDGVFNADPKEYGDNVILLEQIPYGYALELAYSGAKVIHPKTLKPLENKNIPLYVKPFKSPDKSGTIINNEKRIIRTPIFITDKNQVLISISAKDLSSIFEESLLEILDTFREYKHKVNMIQSSAVSVSISTSENRNFDALISKLQEKFKVLFNKNLEIVTIKNYTQEILDREITNHHIHIEQKTQKTVRLLRNM